MIKHLITSKENKKFIIKENIMKRNTELLIEMAREVYAENQNLGHIAGTYETLKDVCNENFQTPYEAAKACLRGNLKTEKHYELYMIGFDDDGNDAIWGFETENEYFEDILTRETENEIVEEYKNIFPNYEQDETYLEYLDFKIYSNELKRK